MKYDEILKTFCDQESNSRYQITTPFIAAGFVMATDGYCAMRVPITEVEGEYGDTSKIKNPGQVFIESPTVLDAPLTVDADKLRIPEFEAILTAERLNPPKKCNECSGEGTHECTCGHEHDCRECDGFGYEDEFEPLPPGATSVWLSVAPIQYRILAKVLDAVKNAGLTTLDITALHFIKPMRLKAGPMEFIIMTMRLTEGECAERMELPV